jgi:hypothetical protein
MKNKNQQCNLYLPATTVAMLDRVAQAIEMRRSVLANLILLQYLEPTVINLYMQSPALAAVEVEKEGG